MSYQRSWQEKAKKLPEEIFSRLEKTNVLPSTPQRALLIGNGIELFLPGLNKLLPLSGWKLFISRADERYAPPHQQPNTTLNNPTVPHDNIVCLKGKSAEHLKSFPAEIFNLIISLWDLPSQSPANISYTKSLYRLLKKKGRVSIITYIDGSPELPLSIIKKIIYQRKLPLKIFKSALPTSAGIFRKMLNKTDFGDIRIWKDNIACTYQSTEDLYNDIITNSEENLFMNSTTDEQRIIIKKEFIRLAEEYSFPLKVSYDFVGGVGVKP